MYNEDFEADWTPCEALLKKSHVPPSYPVFLRMYVLRPPHREETTKIRSIELIHTVPIYHKIEQEFFSSSYRSIWVPKNAKFHANSKSEDKIEKKCTNKKLLLKNYQKSRFLGITFLSCGFFSILSLDLDSA